MDAHVKDVVREMSKASDEERITFPEVVKALMKAGIERYHADLVAGRKTYYLPADAGCVSYFVSLAGRRAVYYGRTGDEHVEWFPGAKP
jgi:uncharacterized protein YbcV (DUF1398 family)